MTDTDKLKRLAEWLDTEDTSFMPDGSRQAILALIAESERLDVIATDLQSKHDVAVMRLSEAVALLRGLDSVNMYDEEWLPIEAFLARIDGNHQPASDARLSHHT